MCTHAVHLSTHTPHLHVLLFAKEGGPTHCLGGPNTHSRGCWKPKKGSACTPSRLPKFTTAEVVKSPRLSPTPTGDASNTLPPRRRQGCAASFMGEALPPATGSRVYSAELCVVSRVGVRPSWEQQNIVIVLLFIDVVVILKNL